MTSYIKVTQFDKVTLLTLNRPEKRNALNAEVITEFHLTLKKISQDSSKILLINGEGDHFCAGGDIEEMQRNGLADEQVNLQDAELLAELLLTLYTFPKPTVVLAHGATLGGGMGLVTAADIAICSHEAKFGFPEVRIGLIPAVISPYVIAAIGKRNAQYYFLTAEQINAERAYQLGLILQKVDRNELINAGKNLANILLEASPHALHACKKLIRDMSMEVIDDTLAQVTAKTLAELRATRETQEGLSAFIEKRKPSWRN